MRVAVVGATGAVGREFLRVLEQSLDQDIIVSLFAGDHSAGTTLLFRNQEQIVEKFHCADQVQADFIFLATNDSFSRQHAFSFVRNGAIVIDNSAAWRCDERVPLVVPEINATSLATHCGVIASPNCMAAILAVALQPIDQLATMQDIFVSTYQAASGCGIQGLQELEDGIQAHAEKRPFCPRIFAHRLDLNIIPHIGEVTDTGYSSEEQKVMRELPRIFNRAELKVSCTAVRVPTPRTHAATVVVHCAKNIDLPELLQSIVQHAALTLLNDALHAVYPMPLSTTGARTVAMGRIRHSALFGQRGIEFFVAGDQLLKGAALNAWQIIQCCRQ